MAVFILIRPDARGLLGLSILSFSISYRSFSSIPPKVINKKGNVYIKLGIKFLYVKYIGKNTIQPIKNILKIRNAFIIVIILLSIIIPPYYY